MLLPWLVRAGWLLLLVLGGVAALASAGNGNLVGAWSIVGAIVGFRLLGELSIILFGIHEELRAIHTLLAVGGLRAPAPASAAPLAPAPPPPGSAVPVAPVP